jgi:flagella basal body P-ring formation protein FlgA
MQLLCRLLFAGLLLWTLPGWAQPSASQAPASAVASASSPREQMLKQAQQWAAAALARQPGQVQFAPLDDRVQVRACERALAFDWPFPGRETVRVRCTAPASPWQLYLRLTESAGPTVRPAAVDTPVVSATRKVVVARRALSRGTVLQPDMVELVEVTVGPALVSPLEQPTQVQHAELLRDVAGGSPIQGHDLRRAVLVKQGQMAVLSLGQGQGFEIAVRVEVLQDGRMGEQVRLKNPESGKALSGVVTGPNTLRGL